MPLAYPNTPMDVDIQLDLKDSIPNWRGLVPDVESSYPDTSTLQWRISEKRGVSIDQVRVTAGADDALWQLITAFLEPGLNLITTSPCFPMIPRYVAAAGGELKTCQWLDGDFPTQSLISQIDDKTSVVLVTSPNNPTGRCIPFDQILSLAENASNSVFVWDAVYADYCNQSPLKILDCVPNSVIVESFSKSYGVPGARLGFAITSNPEILERMAQVAQPYSVSTGSLALGATLLDQETEFSSARQKIIKNRELLQNWLQDQGISVLPSDANFLLVRSGSATEALTTCEQLKKKGILVRSFAPDSEIGTYLRVGVPYTNEDLALFQSAWMEVTSCQ
ncbi:MAG: histidinol-phosphate aminotransferase family protein [Armatimonadetes bacterium]|nr:histidinol-phosphate aminotransferase family protein [Armatimonadota bacterium]